MQERTTRHPPIPPIPPIWPEPGRAPRPRDASRGYSHLRGAGSHHGNGGNGGNGSSGHYRESGMYGSYGTPSQTPARIPHRQQSTRRVAGVLGLVVLVAAGGLAAVGGGAMPVFAAHGPGLQITVGGMTLGSSSHTTATRGSDASQGGKGGTTTVAEKQGPHAQAKAVPNQDCTLIVPSQPLSATGLATPYRLTATRPGGGPCHEANAMQSAFVQAAVFDPATGQISVYDPLVIDADARPAAAPVVPTLPANAVVALWFGFNGGVLRLRGMGGALHDGACVNGLPDSPFGQMAYCNAPAFFTAANQAIASGKLNVPALGTGRDGQICPTVRDYSVVDQDPSDNVTTTYLVTGEGRLAQSTRANAQSHPNATALSNGSDNGLLSHFIDGALGCQPWTAPDLADPGQMVTALPLDELQAAADQASPIALVPSGDPMTLVDGKPNLQKQNLYRLGVDQPPVTSLASARQGERAYCQLLLTLAPTRLNEDKPYTSAFASPMPTAANNLFTFLAQRLRTSLGPQELGCTALLGVRNPVSLVTNEAGVVTRATIATKTTATQGTQQGTQQVSTTAPVTQAATNATNATSTATATPGDSGTSTPTSETSGGR